MKNITLVPKEDVDEIAENKLRLKFKIEQLKKDLEKCEKELSKLDNYER
jgi:hypothetical protein